MIDDAITVEDLVKTYRVYDSPLDALKEVVFGGTRHRELRALDSVSLRVRRGERVGLIGANGAGKSTLLKILSRTIDHTEGSFEVRGRLRAVLELGTGFHDEASGRENILMGGLCMGYTRRELESRIDWVIDFSELGPVIDRPVRTYSSGMKSRLMYAVAFCLPVEIMIVDEALATGDGAFVRKCTQHIVELCNGGATALVVSHNLYFLERMCDRVVYLRRGRVVADGDPLGVCKLYEEDMGRDFVEGGLADSLAAETRPDHGPEPARVVVRPVAPAETPRAARASSPTEFAFEDPSVERIAPGRSKTNGTGEVLDPDGTWRTFDFSGAPAVREKGWVRLVEAGLYDVDGQPVDELVTGAPARFRFVLESRVRKDDVHIGFMIVNADDVHVGTTTNVCSLDAHGRPNGIRQDLREGRLEVEVVFPTLRLGAGRYTMKFGVSPGYEHFSDDDLLLREWHAVRWTMARPDHVQDVLYEPISRWTPLRHVGDVAERPDGDAAEASSEAARESGEATEAAPGAAQGSGEVSEAAPDAEDDGGRAERRHVGHAG